MLGVDEKNNKTFILTIEEMQLEEVLNIFRLTEYWFTGKFFKQNSLPLLLGEERFSADNAIFRSRKKFVQQSCAISRRHMFCTNLNEQIGSVEALNWYCRYVWTSNPGWLAIHAIDCKVRLKYKLWCN